MPRVAFTANIQRHVPCPDAVVPGGTIREALDAVFAANPRARSYVLDDQDALHLAVDANKDAAVPKHEVGHVVPARRLFRRAGSRWPALR
jgi:molybdopterin synthase sulfur carrier subunit